MKTSLSERVCAACRGDSPPLDAGAIELALAELIGWSLESPDGINQFTKVYKFTNFVNALAFTEAVGALAEEYGHHPALLTEWGRVKVCWWTHKIKGVHENDAIMAAKTEQLFSARFAPDKT